MILFLFTQPISVNQNKGETVKFIHMSISEDGAQLPSFIIEQSSDSSLPPVINLNSLNS